MNVLDSCLGNLPSVGAKLQGKCTQKKAREKARVKYLSNGLANALKKLDSSPLHNSYLSTYYCSSVMIEHEGKLITTYCKNRWCLTCNRIRIANLINGYRLEIEAMKDPYFVTLTCRTVDAENLKNRIDEMIKEWRMIYENSRGQKRKLKGIRKLECTARPGGKYHPHFHFMLDGKESAEWVLEQWLKRWPQESEREAQDLRKANKGSCLELFKYFTKLITKQIQPGLFNSKTIVKFMHAERLDVIFQAMRKRRVYDAFGGVKRVNEDDTKEVSVLPSAYVGQVVKWVDSDWFDTQTGKALTGWMPDEWVEQLAMSANENEFSLTGINSTT